MIHPLGNPVIIGRNPAFLKTVQMAVKISASSEPVLIEGESGTGKEVLASLIHRLSPRQHGPYFAQNCGAIPEGLIESEFFGYEKGAFTGAEKSVEGIFERTSGGTLFLDEIANMNPELQKKLLRVLEEMKIRRLGGRKLIPVDPRIISASNERLEDLMKRGIFRMDLYYRLKVIYLCLPPLRERPEDIPLLARHFLQETPRGKEGSITQEAMNILCSFPWPGNIRQLRNEIIRASLFGEGKIDAETLSPELAGEGCEEEGTLPQKLRNFESKEIWKALVRTHWNVSQTAKRLGISRRTLQRRILQYRISPLH